MCSLESKREVIAGATLLAVQAKVITAELKNESKSNFLNRVEIELDWQDRN